MRGAHAEENPLHTKLETKFGRKLNYKRDKEKCTKRVGLHCANFKSGPNINNIVKWINEIVFNSTACPR